MYRNIIKIRIQNFQSHEYTIIDLDRGVNVIVGKTDSGKSAIIRALRWLFFNEPRGTDFIRNGTDEAIVELLYDDGYIVRRIRNKKVNGYETEYDGNIETYYGIGTDVPEEIKKITGVRKIKFSENNEPVMINFQNQHDGAFMLNDSPSQKAKSIGYISNVNVIDEAIRKANQYELNSKQEKRRYELELENNENELKQYNNLDEEISNLNEIKTIFEIINKKNEEKNHLLKHKNDIDDIVKSISIGTEYIKKFTYIDEATKILFNLNKKSVKLNLYHDLLFQYRNNYKEIKSTKNVIDNLKDIDIYRSKFEKLNLLINKFHFVNKLYVEKTNNHSEILTYQMLIDKTNSISNVKDNLIELSEKINILKSLKSCYMMLDQINNNIENVDKLLKSKNIDSINVNYEKLKTLNTRYDLYKSFMEKYNILNNEYSIIKLEFKKIDENISEMVKAYLSLIEMSGICPLCGSIMDDNHLNKIKKEYGYEL